MVVYLDESRTRMASTIRNYFVRFIYTSIFGVYGNIIRCTLTIVLWLSLARLVANTSVRFVW